MILVVIENLVPTQRAHSPTLTEADARRAQAAACVAHFWGLQIEIRKRIFCAAAWTLSLSVGLLGGPVMAAKTTLNCDVN